MSEEPSIPADDMQTDPSAEEAGNQQEQMETPAEPTTPSDETTLLEQVAGNPELMPRRLLQRAQAKQSAENIAQLEQEMGAATTSIIETLEEAGRDKMSVILRANS